MAKKKLIVGFKIKTDDYYNPIKYKQKTITMDLVVDDKGFILFDPTADKAMEIVRETVIPKMKENVEHSTLLWVKGLLTA